MSMDSDSSSHAGDHKYFKQITRDRKFLSTVTLELMINGIS